MENQEALKEVKNAEVRSLLMEHLPELASVCQQLSLQEVSPEKGKGLEVAKLDEKVSLMIGTTIYM